MGTDHEIVVVGAGITGLTAAHELRDRSPLVLEAGDRPGGRVHTVDLAGRRMNLGAEYWIDSPGDTEGRALLGELGVEIETHSTTAADGLVVDDRYVAVTSSEALADALDLAGAARADLAAVRTRIADTLDELWSADDPVDLVAELMSRTAATWLGDVDPAVRRLYQQLSTITPSLDLDDAHALSFLTLLPAVAGTVEHQYGAETIRGGTRSIVEALAARLDPPPVYGATVLAIEDDGDGVRVHVSRHGRRSVVTARTAIVTVPAPVAARVCVDLPAWKLAALRAVFYIPWLCVDIVVDLDADVDPAAAPGPTVSFLDGPMSLLIDATHGEGTERALRLFAGGVRAEPFLDAGIDRFASLAEAQLRRAFPSCSPARGRASSTWIAGAPHLRWGSDYGTPHNIEALLRPVDNIHFAGDYMGFVDAAADGGFGRGPIRDFRTTSYLATAMRSARRAAAAAAEKRPRQDSNLRRTV